MILLRRASPLLSCCLPKPPQLSSWSFTFSGVSNPYLGILVGSKLWLYSTICTNDLRPSRRPTTISTAIHFHQYSRKSHLHISIERTCNAKSSPPHGAPARRVSQPSVGSSFFEESRCEEQERETQPSNAASSLVFGTMAPSKIASHLRSRFTAKQQQVSFCLILRWLQRCLYATKGHLTEPALASGLSMAPK